MKKPLLILFLMSALAGCASKLAVYDYDPGRNYQQLQSYSLSLGERNSFKSLDGARIEAAIKQELSGRYTLVDNNQSADFRLIYFLEAAQQRKRSGLSFGVGLGGSNVSIGASTAPKSKVVVEGRLVLEIVDTASKQVFWTAKGNKNLTESMSPEERQALIQRLVADMLGNFPP